ncbi:hypothetical protein O3P69_011813 [Scylla paramamosain]|uniref:Uncharacterized protein n=1 Tax=Scylla paramamosain TaxID=85552 RepID=A0AAW0SCV7_SCYPA
MAGKPFFTSFLHGGIWEVKAYNASSLSLLGERNTQEQCALPPKDSMHFFLWCRAGERRGLRQAAKRKIALEGELMPLPPSLSARRLSRSGKYSLCCEYWRQCHGAASVWQESDTWCRLLSGGGGCWCPGGNTESKWKKPWETSMTQEQAHLTGSLVTDRWFRPTGRHDVSATTQGVKPRGGRGAFKRHQLASSPFRSAASTSGGGHGHLDMDDTGLGAKY